MKKAICTVPLLLLSSIAQSWAQAPQQEFTDPVALLKAVAKNYAVAADRFHMESISEMTQNGELRREWNKTYHTAIKGPGNLYRIVTRSSMGSYIQLSDGVNEWVYLVELKSYVKRPVPQNWPQFPKRMAAGMNEVTQAWNMRTFLEATAGEYKQATMLPAETIEVEGKSYPCYVVHVTSDDSSVRDVREYRTDTTFWIDKSALVFRKQLTHSDSHMMLARNIVLPIHFDQTTVYPVVDFHSEVPAEMFRFTPPADAKEVASLDPDFGTPSPDTRPKAQMVGQTAPDVSFTSKDGTKIALSSFHGKPLLIDMWATWCGPCLVSMSLLNHVYTDAKNKGLMLISVDQDRDPEGAVDYLARHHYGWSNYHDPDRAIEKAFQGNGIPLAVLIDAQGKIVYYDFGGDEAGLRKAIAGLGPGFASVAPAEAKPVAASGEGSSQKPATH